MRPAASALAGSLDGSTPGSQHRLTIMPAVAQRQGRGSSWTTKGRKIKDTTTTQLPAVPRPQTAADHGPPPRHAQVCPAFESSAASACAQTLLIITATVSSRVLALSLNIQINVVILFTSRPSSLPPDLGQQMFSKSSSNTVDGIISACALHA